MDRRTVTKRGQDGRRAERSWSFGDISQSGFPWGFCVRQATLPSSPRKPSRRAFVLLSFFLSISPVGNSTRRIACPFPFFPLFRPPCRQRRGNNRLRPLQHRTCSPSLASRSPPLPPTRLRRAHRLTASPLQRTPAQTPPATRPLCLSTLRPPQPQPYSPSGQTPTCLHRRPTCPPLQATRTTSTVHAQAGMRPVLPFFPLLTPLRRMVRTKMELSDSPQDRRSARRPVGLQVRAQACTLPLLEEEEDPSRAKAQQGPRTTPLEQLHPPGQEEGA